MWRGTNAIPSWNWRGCEGNKAVVKAYADAATVKLQLNGKRVGKKKVKDCKASFRLNYAPGTLTAIACDASGTEIGRNMEKSPSKPGTVPVDEGGCLFVSRY